MKVLEDLFIQTFFNSGFYKIKLSLSPSSVERAPIVEIYFLLLRGQRSQRALLTLATSWAILVAIINTPLWNGLEQSALDPENMDF